MNQPNFLMALVIGLSPGVNSQSVVPVGLVRNGALEQIRFGHQAGRVSTKAAEKEVRIEWSAMALFNGPQIPEDQLGNPLYTWATGEQQFTTRYWPTSCCVLDNTSLVVCGKSEIGETVIERWHLAWPTPMPAPSTDQQTGVISVGIALPTLGARTELYKANVAGRMLARNVCGIRKLNAACQDLLVQFEDSSDVYVLSLSTQALTLLASATNASAALGLVPALATPDEDYILFGDKIGGFETGFTYTFGVSRWGSSMVVEDPDFASLILLDADRDGVIETTRFYANAQRATNGWTTVTNFADYWKP